MGEAATRQKEMAWVKQLGQAPPESLTPRGWRTFLDTLRRLLPEYRVQDMSNLSEEPAYTAQILLVTLHLIGESLPSTNRETNKRMTLEPG